MTLLFHCHHHIITPPARHLPSAQFTKTQHKAIKLSSASQNCNFKFYFDPQPVIDDKAAGARTFEW